MPILTPHAFEQEPNNSIDLSQVDLDPSILEEVFEENGINSREGIEYPQREITTAQISPIISDNGEARKEPELSEGQKLRRKLNKNGASVEQASKTIANLMQSAKADATKLRAAEIVLDLHGVRDKDGNANVSPIFQFFIKDSSVNLNAIFAPVRQTKEQINQLRTSLDDESEGENDERGIVQENYGNDPNIIEGEIV